jgi:uncharacterized membrane protein YcaP (DUF421 family)
LHLALNLAQVFTADWLMELTEHIPVIIARSVLTFLVVLVVVRWTGKRSIANLAPFDLAMVILIGEVAAIPVADLKVDLLHGILPVCLVGGLHVLVTTLAVRFDKFEKWTEGQPTLLVKDGKVLKQNLLKERVSMADLVTALRHKEVDDVSQVKEAWIEHAGGVSVIRKEEAATPQDLEAAIERLIQANAVRIHRELQELLREHSSKPGG